MRMIKMAVLQTTFAIYSAVNILGNVVHPKLAEQS